MSSQIDHSECFSVTHNNHANGEKFKLKTHNNEYLIGMNRISSALETTETCQGPENTHTQQQSKQKQKLHIK